MAEKTEFTEEQMIKKLKEWTKDKNMIDGGTFNRCMKACFGKPYEAIKSTVESSIWPKHQDKPTRKVCLDEKVKVVALVYEVGTLLKKDAAEMRKAIVETKVGPPATTFSKTGGVDKMTDASKYTGAHKERFRADGKGKGIEGRVDKVEGSGYVGNYKNKDTYDKKH